VALFKNNEGRPFFRAGFTGFFHGLFKSSSNPGSVTGDFKTASLRGSYKVGKVEGDFNTAQLQGRVKPLAESNT
jgi:hypothetical protein